jgi:hypothetical protein
MKKMDRRRFLRNSATASALALPAVRSLAQAAAPAAATLTLHPEKPGPTVPINFVGVSYETQQLSDSSFFSPLNTGLIEQFRALTPHGVLRLGGNTSDVGWWKPTPSSKQPPLPPKVVIVPLRPDERPFQQLAYAVTPEAVRNLRSFLDATGWTCLYGINLGTSTPERAAQEAVFAAKTLGWAHEGGRLEYFQIGNEPDGFPSRFRDKATWTADTYFDEWLASAEAVRAGVPAAQFGVPDTAGHPQWSTRVAERLAALPAGTGKGTRPHIAALTHHYYFGGPPSNPKVNIDRLLQPDPRVRSFAATVSVAAAQLSSAARYTVPYRMSEGNTCYRGGKPGVSDVFAASLWAADYMLTLASLGYVGVNLHGGSGKAVADSLGGTLPGELLMPNPNAPHPRPFYTPIAEIDGGYVAEPVNHGMRFAGHFAGATIHSLTFNPGTVNATAYAAKLPTGQTVVALLNKDASQPLTIDLPGFSVGHIMTARSLTSTTVEDLEPNDNREASTVPPMTAMLLYASRE